MDKSTELEKEYIHLFEVDEKGKPLRGIETPDGWFNHVKDMLNQIDYVVERYSTRKEQQSCKIFQIKEKFGELRVYHRSSEIIHNTIESIISRTEGKCELTCANCGKIDDLKPENNNGWISVICPTCKEKFQR